MKGNKTREKKKEEKKKKIMSLSFSLLPWLCVSSVHFCLFPPPFTPRSQNNKWRKRDEQDKKEKARGKEKKRPVIIELREWGVACTITYTITAKAFGKENGSVQTIAYVFSRLIIFFFLPSSLSFPFIHPQRLLVVLAAFNRSLNT